MIVTAEVVPSSYSVRLTATAYTGTVSWYRSEARDVLIGEGPVIEDRAAPLNQPLTYHATDDVSTVTAAPIEITADKPVLSSTMAGGAHPVTVISYRPYDGQGRSVWHPVIGRSDPFVSVFPATYPAGELVLRCATNSERVALIQLLQAGAPLLLRSTCDDRLDTMTFLMTSWSDPYARDGAQGGPVTFTIAYQRVTEVSPAWSPPSRTFQDVLDEDPDFQGVLDSYASFQALLDGVRSP